MDFFYIYYKCYFIGQSNEISNGKDNRILFFFMNFGNNILNLYLVRVVGFCIGYNKMFKNVNNRCVLYRSFLGQVKIVK